MDKAKTAIEFAEYVNGGHGDLRKIYSYCGDAKWEIITPSPFRKEPEYISGKELFKLYTLFKSKTNTP